MKKTKQDDYMKRAAQQIIVREVVGLVAVLVVMCGLVYLWFAVERLG